MAGIIRITTAATVKEERITIMKKIVMMLVVMASIVTTTFAENESVNVESSMTSVNAYDMSVNIRRLGETLGLTLDQMETVEDIHRTFCGEMMVASQAHHDDRAALVTAAVNKELKYMSYILTPTQYAKYDAILEATLVNHGLK